jgi:hypothetical protein
MFLLEVAWNRNTIGIAGYFCLALDDFDEMYDCLKGAGMDFASVPVVTVGRYKGSKTVYLYDPDQISLQLMEIHNDERQT